MAIAVEPALSPHLTVYSAAAAIDFYVKAFDAVEIGRVPRPDGKFQRALDAGATVVMPLEEQFWGDRYGMVADPFGHRWSLGQPVREVSYDEIASAMGG
jgi:PhnB protein